ncbi:MAG: hypothetical protein ACRD68_15640, partial [Pyrinomonadaceae bacterium]
LEHHAQARTEILRALAEACEAAADSLDEETGAGAARLLSCAALQTYGRAIELFSTLDDRHAAVSASRLLDAECARLRRLDTAAPSTACGIDPEGGICTTPPESHTPIARPPQPSPLPQQR